MGQQCVELRLLGVTTEKCVSSFSASDSENESDRVGDHLAGRRLSQQVMKVFRKTFMLSGKRYVVGSSMVQFLSSSRKDKEERIAVLYVE